MVETDEILRRKVHLPTFDPISSRNVQLSGLKKNEAALEENTPQIPFSSYPRWNKRIAYVVPTGNSPEIIHLRLTNPGNFFTLITHFSNTSSYQQLQVFFPACL